jgi:hypothetical protein
MMIRTRNFDMALVSLHKICSASDDFSINIGSGGFEVYWKTIQIECGADLADLCEAITACQTLDRLGAKVKV